MKICKLLISFSFLLSSFSTLNAQHTILGDFESCYGECKTYDLSGGLGGPYYWKTTGEFEGTNQGTQVEICWNTIGSNTVTLVDFSAPPANQIQEIVVAVIAIPNPQIIPPKYPECTTKDSIPHTVDNEFVVVECITACSESIGVYSFEENNGATVSWEIDGGTIISNDPDGITVQWNPSGSGFIKLTEENSLGCMDSAFYCVEILEPLDVDILAFNGGPNSVNVCADQEVYLQALGSIEATSFEWVMGNGNLNYGTNITASYSEGGVYTIMLIGSTECKCFDTSYYEIIVDSNPGPEITCTGTTCGNEDHTYFAANTCSTYTWTVSGNGTVMDGGNSTNDYITVNWNSGPVGTVGLSTSGCSEAVCANETVVQIPIMDGSATIDGPTVACKAGHSNYSIQYYNGTDYNWNISGNGTIVQGWGSNQITVKWDDDPNQDYSAVVSVNYENCFLECSGMANLNVDLKPDFDISFDKMVCSGNQTYIRSVEGWNSAVVSWTITSPSGIVSTYPDIAYFNETFTETGIYSIVAVDNANNYCNNEISSFFEIIEKPAAPLSIEGPLVICKNQFYNYSVATPDPNLSVIWRIYDGSNFKQIKANSASVQWNSNGPYEIQVYYSRKDSYCPSENLVVSIEAAENATISGSSVSCVDAVETYSVGATNGTLPFWSISPNNAGSIIHNPDNTIDVMWHLPGNHQIISDYCGSILSFNVDVNPLGANSVVYLEEICPGEVTPITSTIPVGSTIEIRDEFDMVIGTSISENVPNGRYEVEITSVNGCIEVISVVIDTFLSPSIRVSSPDENAFCQPHSNVSIVALNTKDGYTYEWYHDNVAMGITTPTISTNQYGDYHVQVTDINGCTAISNVHTLHEWCMGDPPPGTCTGSGNGVLGIIELGLTCNSKQFSVFGSSYSSTSFTWHFGDPDSGVNNTSMEDSPIHNFTNAGYYYVFVFGNMPGEGGVDIITIPAAPRFDYERACAGNEVQFRNHSTFIPGHDITNYSWTFDDPSSGADNTSSDENPAHIFNSAGTYKVTLEIESTNGCTSTYDLEVIVEEGPLAEFILPVSACTDDGILFKAIQDDDIYTYEWDFDDPASGAANNSENPIAIHTFSSTGAYNVMLSVTDGENCVQSITKTIDVTTTSLSGNITANQSFPICFGDDVTLTAPSGGTGYLWSDGSLGQSITVSDPGIYYVTITENTDCDYVPSPIHVTVEGLLDNKIRATLLEEGYSGPSYFDSLEICEGELFSLSISWVSGGSYLWSSGQTSSYVSEYLLSGLPAGRHEYRVTITDPNSGCDIESEPMTIIVNALPDAIQISSSTMNPCEGEVHTLSVDNPELDLLYYWSNGSIGLSTLVSKGGSYTVTAKNRKGCERESNGIYVAPLPNANRINLGCTEACFPDTICTPNISGVASYQWLLDGVPLAGINGTSRDLIADQAGEYRLVVENYHGCRDTSDILAIEAEPSNQTISGIVFIDDNNNGIWDMGEELLVGVPVNLYSGSILESTVLTDFGGYYNFDPVTISNPRIEIDTVGLGLNLTGGILEDDVDFTSCIEDKEKNFPLNRDCTVSTEEMILFTCADEALIINSIVLQAGDSWTFDDLNAAGCDSTTYVNVAAYPESDINLATTVSCLDIDNGTLDIAVMTGTGLLFAVDNNSSFTSNLQFTDLAPGMHMLWMTDDNGCTKNYSFEIEPAEIPEMNIVAQNTCENDNSGMADIISTIMGNYQYSIDGSTFSSSTQFLNLGVGTHTIYVQEDNNCIYEYPFVIAVTPEPQFDLLPKATCSTGVSGSLEIIPLSTGSFEYSLDNITFTSTSFFSNLPAGNQTLFVQEIGGCSHSYLFDIPTTDSPLVEYIASKTCEGESMGSIHLLGSIPQGLDEYEISIDGINFSNDLEFNNLSAGQYTIYILEDGICQFEFPVEIEVESLLTDITFDTEDACVGIPNGSVTINTNEVGLEYSLDQINFSSNEFIDNLETGIHTIYVRGENDCIHPFDIEILEAGELEIEFFEPIIDCSIQEANLAPTIIDALGNLNYNWSTGATDSMIMAQNSGEYTLLVSDKCASQEYTWDIEFEEISKEQPVYFPNIFSPNQDGVNECFVPVVRPETTILNYHLIIYDRWGNKYFETTDMADCWDGMYNGKNVRTGVFVYLLDIDYTYCVEVESLQKYGDVTIIH